jgi:hypothetical protein
MNSYVVLIIIPCDPYVTHTVHIIKSTSQKHITLFTCMRRYGHLLEDVRQPVVIHV